MTKDSLLHQMDVRIGELYQASIRVGDVPPGPRTRRARVGAFLIGGIKRSLFWLLPQLDKVHTNVIATVAGQRDVLAHMMSVQQDLLERADRTRLEAEVVQLRQQIGDLDFRLHSQQARHSIEMERLRGEIAKGAADWTRKGEPDSRRIGAYLAALERHNAGGLEMPVLDICSGNGEWLAALENHGMHALGVEASYSLAHASSSRGFRTVAADPMAYLASLPAKSLGAITAWNQLQLLSVVESQRLLSECFRVLKPGGIILIEGTDAGAAAHLQSLALQQGFIRLERMEDDPHHSAFVACKRAAASGFAAS